ncbi:FAT domain-containing protein [Sphaerosporella brunnea]|uniref:FAT domain-containing protein n=1 Tax=Sphaerosporella brunnea TaxID=1250544 RepID=A0A5J5EWX3_9PEZI|nr:FAT domain-containing protein [Sphaerosporella brunnea]
MDRLLKVAVELREKSKAGEVPIPIKLAVEQASATAVEIFMIYLTEVDNDLDFLFRVIEATTSDKRARTTNILTHHIYEKIICKGTIEQWRNIINKCLGLYSTNASQETKTFAFHYLVNPILAMDKKRGSPVIKGEKLVDKNLIENVHKHIWKPNLGDLGDEHAQGLYAQGLDHSRMELLQMSALLIRDHQQSLAEARKDVIKFGWNYIKLEDIVNKQAAYVLIAFFIKHFDTPSKIVIQIYVALLKAHQHEGRPLVTQALELIAPVLKKRVPTRPEDKYPIWARWPRRILSEEGHNPHQMTNIFQFLVRHDDLFFDSREHFATWIVTALPKLVFQIPNPSTEYKKLFIKLVTLIWKWEQHRVATARASDSPEVSPPRKRKLDTMMTGIPQSVSQIGAAGTDAIPTQLRTLVIRHLVQFICRLPEKYSGKPDEPCTKALQLLRDFLGPEYWGGLEIDLFPKIMTEYLVTNDITDNTLAGFVNSLNVLNVIMDLKTDEWIMQQLPQIQTYLDKPLRSDSAEVQESLQPVLARVLTALPIEKVEGEDEDEEPKESPESQFIASLGNIVQENLNTNLMSSVHILHTLSIKRPGVIDDHISALMKAFQKLGKDHLSVPAVGQPGSIVLANGAKPETPGGNTQMFDPDTTTKLLCMVIDVSASRVSVLHDQRRPFLSVMAQLVEKSTSTTLCKKILGIVENWVFRSTETFPTLKEKTAVLSKMLSFESRPNDPELCNSFLELVIKIYEDPVITKTELTVRLEHAFLVGTRAKDVNMRNRFLQIFDRSISRTVSNRFSFVMTTQNWESLSDSYWLHQATHLLFGSVEMDQRVELHNEDLRVMPASSMFLTYGAKDPRKSDVMLDDKFEEFMCKHKKFLQSLADVRSADILEPVRQLQHLDPKCGHDIWVSLFPLCWSAMGKEDRIDLSRGMVSLLAKDWHSRAMDKRPNVIQSLLEGVELARPKLNLPAHLVKYLSRNYDAWYTALHLLEENVIRPPVEAPVVRDSNLDALTEMYATVCEEDMFYGLWRRRANYIETNSAISFEQHGMWDKAQQMYETAQINARTAMLPFSASEYMLWEDHWVICAQKLQQWEILSEFAKHENYPDLMLECGWRLIDNWNGSEGERMDQTIKSLMDAPTPRRFFFAAFMALQKVHQKAEVPTEFSRLCDEAIQLSLRKWHSLPKKITQAHIPLLQTFQQLVELHDASVIYASLNATTAQNLDAKSQELKMLLGTWRDRLPNVWDDINAWHDLVTWRQHIFHSINQTYLPLLPSQNQSAGGNSNSYGYRGYHETAWIINRFAHVARKHQLPEVCINQLSKIYTLPNIEIQEAFLKLREQAKCHYQNPNELTQGLEVINNTNLGYFAAQQKAEFYTLKGMFLSKLKQKDEANEAFSLALYHDLKLPKAWAQWGHYNDQLFKENPSDMGPAGNAVSCYLEAAGLYKNGKARKLLGRVLWLLSLDDATASISAAFDAYKGDVPVWYWITYIPQLLTSLSHKEARLARAILIKIAKNYPQALYFLLRTSREDYQVIKKTDSCSRSFEKDWLASHRPGSGRAGSPLQNATVPGQPGAAGSPTMPTAQPNAASPAPPGQNQAPQPHVKRLPWEYAEEIMSVLKTAFPLLALSMETMGDQISKFFKCPPDEDAYRLIVALLNDALQWIARMNPALEDSKLPPSTEANISRFAETILPAHIRVAFEEDFVKEKPNLYKYIERLRRWRDRFEEKLDRRPPYQNLESYSPHLSEFRFQKFDDVEVPGQYLVHKDGNKDFVRIDRFLPKVDVIRGYGICHRRLKMRGHDGSIHAFAVQHPAARHCRREERILQLFRIFNGVLSRRKETRRRNLNFHLPLMVPLAPHLRLVQDDASYISLQGIFEDHCRQIGINKDDPIVFALKKVIASLEPSRTGQQAVDPNVKLEIFNAIQEKFVPSTVVLEFLSSSYPSFSEFFLFRRQFSYQFAALTFLTYVMTMSNRYPHKMFISRATGNIWGSELIPALASTNPAFHSNEPVPFRLTPNIQTLMGPIALEGIFSCAVMTIARCLSEPDFELEQHLSVFVRDEMIFWFTQQHRSGLGEQQLREKVQQNSEFIIKKTASLAQPGAGKLPANQTVIDLISKAVNPANLSQLDHLWMPYL